MGIHPTRVSEKNSATEKTEKTTQYISHCVSSALVLDSRALIDLRGREAKQHFSQAAFDAFQFHLIDTAYWNKFTLHWVSIRS